MAEEEKAEGKLLVGAAKSIGAVAGKIATLAGAEAKVAPPPPDQGQLQKKPKSASRRRQKKAERKARLASG